MKQMFAHTSHKKTGNDNKKSSNQKYIWPSSSKNQIQQLHSSIGNQAVQKLFEQGSIQAKLTMGRPNDKYEQEADRVAKQVMNMPEQAVVQRQAEKNELIHSMSISNTITPFMQRQQNEEEEVQSRYDNGSEDLTPIIESVATGDVYKLAEEEEFIQAKNNTGISPQVTPGIAQAMHSIRGSGQPLTAAERAFFEPRFGTDFSKVRVHTDNRAARTAQSINARAFTLGRDVVFGAGQYSPGTQSGRSLLAHELVHVVQQKGKSNSSQHIYRAPGRQKTPQLYIELDKKMRKKLIANDDPVGYLEQIHWLDFWYSKRFSKWLTNPAWNSILKDYTNKVTQDYKFLTMSNLVKSANSKTKFYTDFGTWIKYTIRNIWALKGDDPRAVAKSINLLDKQLNDIQIFLHKKCEQDLWSSASFTCPFWAVRFHGKRYKDKDSLLYKGGWCLQQYKP
jgi:hypothetical protein